MKLSNRVRRIRFVGEVTSREEASGLLKQPGDAALVLRGTPRWLVLRCPDGCGEDLPVNLDRRSGPAWKLYSRPKGLTLYPSVWRDSGCESHFIIWNDNVFWLGFEDFQKETENSTVLRERALVHLKTMVDFIHYSDLADILDEVPWTVLKLCTSLEDEGLVQENKNEKGHFRLAEFLKLPK
jgi:hypothetical protein